MEFYKRECTHEETRGLEKAFCILRVHISIPEKIDKVAKTQITYVLSLLLDMFLFWSSTLMLRKSLTSKGWFWILTLRRGGVLRWIPGKTMKLISS